jgi:hypothetical protein
MSDHEEARRLEGVILTRLLRLEAWVSVVVGLLAGALIFVIYCLCSGGPIVGPHLALRLGLSRIRVTFAEA